MDKQNIELIIQYAYQNELKELDLSNQNIDEIPLLITQLTQLTRLNLSRNQLNTLPSEIVHLTRLTELYLSGNQFSTLPPEVARLTQLTRLDLSYNQLSTLPPEIAQLTQLIWLGLSGNQFSALPPEIPRLIQLTELDISRNQINTLPPEIASLNQLRWLDINSNQLTSVPPEIAQLIQLTVLYLSDNQISALPPQIAHLIRLNRLDLHKNSLRALPPEIANLNQLRWLDLSSNHLSALPPEIARLTQLTSLNLSNNSLRSLPLEIGHLTQLNRLDLRNNHLNSLPPEIAQLTQLTTLDLNFNQFSDLTPEIVQLTQLTNLDLSRNKLSALPLEIGHLTRLRDLLLNNNSLRALPPTIAYLNSLVGLRLSNNQLTTLPPEIGQLTQLTGVDLSGNQLSAIPPEIAQLAQLNELDISDNQLSTLPPEIAQLTQLTTLNISRNKFNALPLEITQLIKLTGLGLGDNQFSALPPEIGQLTQLKELDLSDNFLSMLPPEIGQLTQLTSLYLINNPLRTLPPEIVEQGTDAILEYLREILNGCEQQWVSKLVLVGEGGVGKTCLLSSLRGEIFTDSPTTRGIEIQSLFLRHPEMPETQLTLNAWDFGGQEIYHATHQFFLTNRSLFLLIWNARHGYEQGKIYYWLDAIQARAPESPVLIVATWLDERDADLPLDELQRKYPQIKGFFKVSNKSGKGVIELKKKIAEIASIDLPLMGEKWPTTWLAAAETIRSDLRKYVQPEEFWQMIASKGVSKAGARVLARWLHELGDILHFRDDNDLNDLIILKPQWVSQYIGKVLDSDDVIYRDGIFTDGHMAQLWSDLDPAMRKHFLRLMEKFDLSYRTLEKEDVSLVVERLPLDPPDYQAVWNQNSCGVTQHEISMKFKLNTILPGIPTWFIARSHRFSTRTHWRMGAVFAYEPERKHLALVQVFPHDRYVQLAVKGPSPNNFFALLKDGLEETFKRYPGLKIERTIPCPENDGYEFNYELLQKALEREKLSIQCPSSFEQVSVPQLLFGFDWHTKDNVHNEIEKLTEIMKQHEKNSIEQHKDIHKDIIEQHHELVTYFQREFIKNYRRDQSEIETQCPNVFTLRPYAAKAWKRTLLGEKLELQLYCQAPGCWHPTADSGHYVFDYPPKWLRAISPYLKDMVAALKFVTPLVGPWIGMSSSNYAEFVKHEIQFMEELVELIPNLDESEELEIPERFSAENMAKSLIAAEGAPLRSIRLLLEQLDKQQAWGGLQRIATPEGPYLWLCEYHAREYKSIAGIATVSKPC